MQRLLRIVLLITFMLLIILWFSTIFNTCNKEDELATNTESVAGSEDSTDVFQDLDDEFFEDDQDLFTDEALDNNTSGQSTSLDSGNKDGNDFSSDSQDDYTDYTGQPSTNSGSSSGSSSGGQTSYNENAGYLVVAGSFLVEENAIRMQQKLQAMGYSAEVRNFNYSQFHSVIAGRYNAKSDADYVASQLKNAGVSCYVHKRQP